MSTVIEELIRASFDAFNDADWERMEPLYCGERISRVEFYLDEARQARDSAALR